VGTKCRDAGADPEIVDHLSGGYTGCVAVAEERPRPRSRTPGRHRRAPVTGLRRRRPRPHRREVPLGAGGVHARACARDDGAHATTRMRCSTRLFRHPRPSSSRATSRSRAGKPTAESATLDDVDYLYAVHVGLDHPSGEVVCGVDGFAVRQFLRSSPVSRLTRARPEQDENAVQAMAAAVQNLYAIPRRRRTDPCERRARGGSSNVIPRNVIPEESAWSTELAEYMRTPTGPARRRDGVGRRCDVSTKGERRARRATTARRDRRRVAGGVPASQRNRRSRAVVPPRRHHLMQSVQKRGDWPATSASAPTTGGHTSTFDVVEGGTSRSGSTCSRAIRKVAAEMPGSREEQPKSNVCPSQLHFRL